MRAGRRSFSRLRGEEFILLIGGSPEAALGVAERIRSEVEDRCSPGYDARVLWQITVSVGVAPLTAETGALENLVAEADKAMYQAKGSGKNRVAIFSAGGA